MTEILLTVIPCIVIHFTWLPVSCLFNQPVRHRKYGTARGVSINRLSDSASTFYVT